MKAELQAKIINDFPEYFPGIFGNPAVTCLAFGLEIGDGWYELFYNLNRDIKATNPEDFKWLQIKEKFGGLRAYYGSASQEVHDLVDKAEAASYTICENCGTKENVTSEGAWITTLCDKCRK